MLLRDWQVDFMAMPPAPGGFKYLLVLVDIFTGWVEAFPCLTVRSNDVVKSLLKEIIPRFGLPRPFQHVINQTVDISNG